MVFCPARRTTQAPLSADRLVGSCAATSLARRPAGDVAPHVTGALAETAVLLEAAAIALGAPALTPESIGLARAADVALRACRHDPPSAARLARIFHQALLAACPNTHMLELIRETSGTGSLGRVIDIGADELGRVADDHEAILDMIAAGAPSCDLERSLRRHASSSALCSMGLARP